MLACEGIERALIVAPHGDDEVLGVGGLMAKLSAAGGSVHVLFFAVDASNHYGLPEPTQLAQRLEEIEAASRLLRFSYEIVYSGRGLLERLDTLPQRDLVDRLESVCNDARPDLLLLPEGHDYDQDHKAVFAAGLAATRPMPSAIGKHFCRRVLTYEMPKLVWAGAFQPRVYWDITGQLEQKLSAVRAYSTQLREPPHVRSLDNLRALARLRGAEIGVDYAEAFGVLRWVP
jgi:LmbE family N-acetylglucosaminyl deacetylase